YPCIQLPISAGNIKNRRFSEIWYNSKWLKEVREFCPESRASCVKCELSDLCQQCPGINYLETRSIYRPSKEICRHTRMYAKALNRKL
ncbi:MAG: hypothetical protein QME51_07125, partial [Planctomycetota bacterium]|nr:hypothetical protein [Planctomycetota bacterium]